MYDTILVPTDGSEAATAAVRSARTLAERFGATLVAVHVAELADLPDDLESTPDGIRREAERVLSAVDDELAGSGVTVETELVETEKPVHEAIVDVIEDRAIDCVVMGTHGRSGLEQRLLGSVTERTLRASPAPVLTVREDTVLDPDIGRILLPIDGSDGSTAATSHAADLATVTDAEVYVLNVADTRATGYSDYGAADVLESLERGGEQIVGDTERTLEDAGVRVADATVKRGTVPRTVTEYAAEHDVACIVMGTHGRTGVGRVLLGSVTERVIGLSDRPVLSVTASDDRGP